MLITLRSPYIHSNAKDDWQTDHQIQPMTDSGWPDLKQDRSSKEYGDDPQDQVMEFEPHGAPRRAPEWSSASASVTLSSSC